MGYKIRVTLKTWHQDPNYLGYALMGLLVIVLLNALPKLLETPRSLNSQPILGSSTEGGFAGLAGCSTLI